MSSFTICLASNPFYQSYIHSDLLGKLIFLALIFLSICSWILLIHKFWLIHLAKGNSSHFHDLFQSQKLNPLSVEYKEREKFPLPNPFLELYLTMKKQAVELLQKNRRFGGEKAKESSHLSLSDVDLLGNQLMTKVAEKVRVLEQNLFVLATIVSLGPFLGLLGTVWGILVTFSQMQTQMAANSNQAVLSGLSLALSTTVLGLISAIPALIGYNYLKNSIGGFQTEMEGFSSELLSCMEMQYCKVDL